MTYVYESQSYRDKETKQPRSKRKLIGRLDDETIKKLKAGGIPEEIMYQLFQ